MLSLSDYINKNNNLFLNTFGSIRFELDESSMDNPKGFLPLLPIIYDVSLLNDLLI